MSQMVYYRSLVKWDRVEEMVVVFDESEREAVRDLIIKTLDHSVMEAALHRLDEEAHEEFLELASQKYHQEELLNWLEERHQDISSHLRQAIEKTKQEMRELLLGEGQV